MKKQLQLILLLIILSFYSSCKGPEGDPGPVGEKGKDFDPAVFNGIKEGFIKDTIRGLTFDSVPYAYPFYFDGSKTEDNTYKVLTSQKTRITISKYYSGIGEKFISGYFYFTFYVKSINDLSTAEPDFADIGFVKDLGNKKIQYTENEVDKFSGLDVIKIQDLNYNSATGIITGKISVVLKAKRENGSVIVNNASFSSKISRSTSRIGEE